MLICVCILSYESKRILKYCFADEFFQILFHEHLVLLGVLYRGKHARHPCVTDRVNRSCRPQALSFYLLMHLHSPSEAGQALYFTQSLAQL